MQCLSYQKTRDKNSIGLNVNASFIPLKLRTSRPGSFQINSKKQVIKTVLI